jgi:hypothetical protein
MPVTTPEILLTPDQVAERLGLSVQTLAIWRLRAFGPRWLKISSRVRYRERDLEEFLASRARTSTSDTGDGDNGGR